MNVTSYMKVGVKLSDGQSKAVADETARRNWNMYAPSEGLKPEHFGAEFDSTKGRMKIIGFNPNKPQNCIMLRNITKNSDAWFAPASSVIGSLKRSGIAV